MNGFQRIHAALKGEKTDTTPIMLHNFMMAASEMGISMKDYRENPQKIAEAHIRAIEKYQYDGILVDLDTVTLAGAVGVPVDFPEHEPARTREGNLDQWEKIFNLPRIDISNYRYVQNWLEGVRRIKEHFGDEIFVRGNCDQAPFSLASMMRGSQNWMLDLLIQHPDEIHQLLRYCSGICQQFIRLMAQTGCDMVSNGDSPAGPDMISPEMYRLFAQPYEQEIVALAHELNLPYTLHICGNTEVILDAMLETGADAFELDYKTNPLLVHEILDGKATLIGNIDPSGVLALGSVELVEKKTEALLSIFAKTNRFILNAGCAIPSGTPEDNLRQMIHCARRRDADIKK